MTWVVIAAESKIVTLSLFLKASQPQTPGCHQITGAIKKINKFIYLFHTDPPSGECFG